MNTLTNKFPTAVLIDGEPIAINTDFRVCLKIQQAFSDTELIESEKIEILIKLLYPIPPNNLIEAVQMGLKFINLGETPTPPQETPVYSFDKDASYIYTAFKSSYNMDLESIEHLHWWKFRALFSDLGDCFFSNLVGIRSRLKQGKLMDHEREFVANNPDIINIDSVQSAADDFFEQWEENYG